MTKITNLLFLFLMIKLLEYLNFLKNNKMLLNLQIRLVIEKFVKIMKKVKIIGFIFIKI